MVEAGTDLPDFTRGIMLLGVDADGNLVGVSVDSDGNIGAILKGQGAGGLETIAVDENGRIQVFILDDESQWGQTIKVGNAELAARLGSTKTWDWRGKVLTINDFSNGLGSCQVTGSGTGYAASVDPTYSIHGGYSAKLIGGSTSDMYVKLQYVYGKNPATRLGLEVCFSDYFTFDYATFGLLVRGQGARYNCKFKYDPGSYLFYYLNSSGAWSQIVNTFPASYPYAFNFMKIVADFSGGNYDRFLLNAVEYDLSSHAMQTQSAGFYDSIEVEIQVVSTSGANRGIFLDYFMVTLDEPSND